MMKMDRNKAILGAVLGVLILFILVNILSKPDAYQGDFKDYYWKSYTYSQGLDPYDIANIKKVMFKKGGEARSVFKERMSNLAHLAYAPFVFEFFSVFTFFEYDDAQKIYLLMRILALLVLLYTWFNLILPLDRIQLNWHYLLNGLVVLLFIMFAWRSAIYTDFRVGNVSVFEQMFLWLGIYFFLGKRYNLFAIFVVLASLIKIVPIVFLGLSACLWFDRENRKQATVSILVGVSGFIFYHLLNYLSNPQTYTTYFFAVINMVDESRGVINPSLMSLLKDFCEWGVGFFSMDIDYNRYANGLFLVCVAGLSIPFFLVLLKRKLYRDHLELVMFTSFYIAAILPRLKNYSFILLVLPAIYFIAGRKHAGVKVFLSILVMGHFFSPYYSYFLLLFIFLFWAREIYLKPAKV